MAASVRRSPPFDRSGIRGQEMLQLMRLGVVPFGTVLLALASADEPELNAIDLPMLNPDIATLRQTVSLWRPRIETLLRERYGIRLLAVYTYPAQVIFCQRAFTGLGDLARAPRPGLLGRPVRADRGARRHPRRHPLRRDRPRDPRRCRAMRRHRHALRQRDRPARGDHACLPRRHQLGRLHLRRQRARLGGAAGGGPRRLRHRPRPPCRTISGAAPSRRPRTGCAAMPAGRIAWPARGGG